MNLRAALAQTLMIGVSGANTSGPRGITDGPTPVGGIFLYPSRHDLAFTSGILRTIARHVLSTIPGREVWIRAPNNTQQAPRTVPARRTANKRR